MKKFTTILAIIAAFLSTDLQWSVMQTVTWVNMIHQSESTASLSEKIVSTVTGEAPCQHCQALADEQGSERNEILSLLGKGPLLAPVESSLFRLTHQGHTLFTLAASTARHDLIFPSGIDHPPRA